MTEQPPAPTETAELAAPTDKRIVVVGIGASAGGSEALTQILRGLPAEPGFAAVWVQHLANADQTAAPESIAAVTPWPVVLAADAMPLEANFLYVIPPGFEARISGQALRLDATPADRTQYAPIDVFFRSLAETARNRAIGVILSGAGRDGTIGAREIRMAGGVTIAQTPETASFDGMPRAAISAGAVDLALPPEAIGPELVRWTRLLNLDREEDGDDAELSPIGERKMQRLFSMLRQSSGIDFANYKSPTIRRRLRRRMRLSKQETLDEYLTYLERSPLEAQRLIQDMLIQVTRFFREPASFDALARLAVGECLEQRGAGNRIRIWVPGCASGEEAYSVAMTCLDELNKRSSNASITIFGTDVSEPAIDRARVGVYPPSIADDVGEERLQRYFNPSDGAYRVRRRLREMCIFARQDLTRDPPFSQLDLIVCRNVLIYLSADVQRKLMAAFHYALRPNGFLMLGEAETIGPHGEFFSVLDKTHRIYRKRLVETASRLPGSPDRFAGAPASARMDAESHAPRRPQAEANRVLLDRYAPPGVIVDATYRILEFRGQTHRYLAPAPGEASLNLLKMARDGLAYGLRSALREAEKNGAPARRQGLRVQTDSRTALVNVEAIPLGPLGESRHYLVLFEEAAENVEPSSDAVPDSADAASEDRRRLARLEQELTAHREYLQSIIHDLEMANEELQSANEEILSSNEELQSTNEELDTAKEELQSTNEELNTVNDDLHGRNAELNRLNGDLMNLISSVRIAIVIVSSDLRIRRFTPMAEQVLNLIPGDVGRPIGQIKPNFHGVELDVLIREAMSEAAVLQREVRDAEGRRYSLTARPYKDVEDRIDGAVLSVFDVDASRRREKQLPHEGAYAQAIIETVREPLLVLDGELRVQVANQAFCDRFAISAERAVGQLIYELGGGQWNIAELRRLLAEIAPENGRFADFRVDFDLPEIGRRVLSINARRIEEGGGRPPLILLAIEDATPPRC